MSTSAKKKKLAGDARVIAAAKQLEQAHAASRQAKSELRDAEGDVRRALSLLRKLTTPARRPSGPVIRFTNNPGASK